jgi:hypothetical protein
LNVDFVQRTDAAEAGALLTPTEASIVAADNANAETRFRFMSSYSCVM